MLINWRNTLRQRLGAVGAAFAASAACCLCGLLLTFVYSPRQALRASRIARLPAMAPADVAAAETGDMIPITGVLDGNPPLRAGSDLVAYRVEEWEVTLADQGLTPEIVQRLVSEHDEIAVLIEQFHTTLRSLAAVEPAVMNTDLRRLSDALRAHLAYEETHVCPLLTRFSGWPML